MFCLLPTPLFMNSLCGHTVDLIQVCRGSWLVQILVTVVSSVLTRDSVHFTPGQGSEEDWAQAGHMTSPVTGGALL